MKNYRETEGYKLIRFFGGKPCQVDFQCPSSLSLHLFLLILSVYFPFFAMSLFILSLLCSPLFFSFSLLLLLLFFISSLFSLFLPFPPLFHFVLYSFVLTFLSFLHCQISSIFLFIFFLFYFPFLSLSLTHSLFVSFFSLPFHPLFN